MKVVLAKYAGFCYGVRRALETVLDAASATDKKMFTLGPLIHNPQVIERLESEGVSTIKSLDDIPDGCVVIMPSHGVPRQVMEQARARGLEIIDVTCPFVRKVHRVAENLMASGFQVILLGDAGHTEVRGILSVCGDDAIVVSDPDVFDFSNLGDKVGVVAQTTQTVEAYGKLVARVAMKAHEVWAYRTICDATMERQHAALDLASDIDLMIVVGGRNSANTRRLAEICSEIGVLTYHVETADEVKDEWFAGIDKVGITAGASTPDWIINEVARKVEHIANRQT
jgi:(E)-4-hydroxy-3-methyl-but-2-enyl pyrophosphate reductase